LFVGYRGDPPLTNPTIRTAPPLDVEQITLEINPSALKFLPPIEGTKVDFPKDFAPTVVDDFDWLPIGSSPNGQHGWEVSPGLGKNSSVPMAVGVRPAPGNNSLAAYAIVGSRGSGMVVSEKAFPDLKNKSDVVVYSFLTRAVPDAKGATMETVAGPRVQRTAEEPLADGSDASAAGLGPRFGFARAQPGENPRFRIIRAGKNLVGRNKGDILTSRVCGRSGDWFELRLVVSVNRADIEKSTGSLFVRNVTAGDSNFTATDLQDVVLGLTDKLQPANFDAWTISGKISGEYDLITVGTLPAPISVPKADGQ
jgi:hypothetical protein